MEIVIILLLILLNGLFAMSEIALISARKSRLGTQARQGSKAAARALRLAEDPDKFLSTIQIGITLIGILTGIYSGAAFADRFGLALLHAGIPQPYATSIAQILIVVAVTYLTLIFGELVPKRLGLAAAERIAVSVARPMQWLATAASPFVWMLSKSVSGVTRLLHLRVQESKVTEEEIKSIVREGMEDGEVQEVEEDIVGRVFSLGDRTVESIMTHRSDLVWLDLDMTAAQIREVVEHEPHTVYPVARQNADRVLGIVYLKDLFVQISAPDFSLGNNLCSVKFFHENTEVYAAMEQLRSERIAYGVVCDEFGVTQGVVTFRDILEALVGSIPEIREEPNIVRRHDGSWLVDGQCPFYDFLEHFGMEDLCGSNPYNTLSGLIIDKLGHIPQTGECLEWHALALEIVDMDGARIDKVLVSTAQKA